MELQLQKINCARRNAITTPKDKLCAEERDYDYKRETVREGMQLQLQTINCAQRNAIMTPKDELCAEECDYDSKR